MAIDNNSLCYLFDPIFQVENIRGIPIVGGHIEVFIAGTDQKYITWQNWDGARNPFKIPLNNDGRATILVEPNYTYDAYIYDSFNNMVCSRLNIRPVVGGDIVVSGITQVWHDESLSGDGTLQSPLTVVSAGKVYSGIEPIVVNNDEDTISANHVPLGLQEPLFFVEDSETACIIGCSAQSELPEGTMNESAFSYDASSNITAYNGSAFKAGDEFPESATEAINVVTAYSAYWNGPYVPLGIGNIAFDDSLAQGSYNSAYFWSMAQGAENMANDRSLAQGSYNSAIGNSMAQGVYNYAEEESMAQGEHNSAYKNSIAQGKFNSALNNSQAFGQCTTATATGMAIGQYNLTQSAAFVIGNGTNSANPSDAFVIDHSGNVSAQGDVSASGISLTSLFTDYQTNSANFITALPADLVYTGDITGFATTADLANKLDKSDSANFLLTGDSANFYTTANESGYLTAVPNTYLQNTDLSTTDGKVTAISGIPLSAGGASYTSPSGSIWISADNIESTDSAYIPSHQEDVLLTATTSWSSMNGYATLANTNKVYFITQGRGSAFDNEGTFLNSSYNSTVLAETEHPPIKLYTNEWVSVRYSAYSAGIMDAYLVELARKNEVNSALNTKLDTSAFTGYYPSNNPSGFAKASDVVPTASINLFDGKIIGINKQYLMGCDSAYNYTLAGSSAATGSLTASAYVGTGHQSVTIEVSGRQNRTHYINWTAFDENGSNLSAGQMSFTVNSVNKVSAFEFNSPLAENISGVKLYGNSTGFTAYSAYTSDVKPLASQDNLTFLSGAIDHVSANSATWNSVTSKLDTSAFSDVSGNFLTAIPAGTMNESAFEYDANDKISGYNGSAFAGGSDVPEGVMVESGLEYNAVNEISGYNGSAIAQYGHEAQWLVHDDTLVHAANSAQYALGVNLSAVAQLLGVDETVLYTGNTAVTAFTASEPFTNFKEVAFYVAPNYETTVSKIVLPMVGYNTSHMALTYHSVWNGFKGGIQISTEYDNTGMSAFQLISGAWFGWANDAAKTGTYNDAWIHKIVGIGRKN